LRTPSAVPVKRRGTLTVTFSPATSSWKSMCRMLRLNGWRWISRISVRAVRPVHVELDHGASRRDRAEQALDLARVDGERLRITAVAIDDPGHLTGLSKLPGDARAPLVANRCVQ
jgi:hypothetical protein